MQQTRLPLLAEHGMVNVELVIEPPWNVNEAHDIPELIASIRRFGFRDEIEVLHSVNGVECDTPKLIIAGSGRWKAAREMRLPEIPAQLQDWDSEASARAYALANNEIARHARANPGALLTTLRELDDLSGTGFDSESIVGLESMQAAEVAENGSEDDYGDLVVMRCPECGHEWTKG